MTLNLDDFQKQDIKFDIAKLQQSYKEIIKTKKFDDGGGITNFGAISLTQIPGDPESIKGSKARGVYWTKPGCIMVIDKVAQHMPADGSVWITNNTKYHNAFNGGEEDRIHLVACVLDYKFN